MAQAPAALRPRPRKGDEIEVAIDSLAHGGAGVGRAEGSVVFVRGAVPGDRVRARIEKAKRSFAEARTIEIVEPSRIASSPPVPIRAPRGRCSPTRASWRRRNARWATPLRLGKFDRPPVAPITPAIEQLRYRNKVEYSFGASDAGELTVGFHHPGRWDLIDDLRDDVLASEQVGEVRDAVRTWCAEEGCRPSIAPPRRLPAQPRDPRGQAHGPNSGAAGHRPGRLSPRRAGWCDSGRQRALDAGRGCGRDQF